MTDIPEDVMKAETKMSRFWLNDPQVSDTIVNALTEARDKALEDAAVMISQRFVGVVPGWIEVDIRAMKSTGRAAMVLTDGEDGP